MYLTKSRGFNSSIKGHGTSLSSASNPRQRPLSRPVDMYPFDPITRNWKICHDRLEQTVIKTSHCLRPVVWRCLEPCLYRSGRVGHQIPSANRSQDPLRRDTLLHNKVRGLGAHGRIVKEGGEVLRFGIRVQLSTVIQVGQRMLHTTTGG